MRAAVEVDELVAGAEAAAELVAVALGGEHDVDRGVVDGLAHEVDVGAPDDVAGEVDGVVVHDPGDGDVAIVGMDLAHPGDAEVERQGLDGGGHDDDAEAIAAGGGGADEVMVAGVRRVNLPMTRPWVTGRRPRARSWWGPARGGKPAHRPNQACENLPSRARCARSSQERIGPAEAETIVNAIDTMQAMIDALVAHGP